MKFDSDKFLEVCKKYKLELWADKLDFIIMQKDTKKIYDNLSEEIGE